MGNTAGVTNVLSAASIGVTIGFQWLLLSLLDANIVLWRWDITDLSNRVYDAPGVSATYDFVIVGSGSAGITHKITTVKR